MINLSEEYIKNCNYSFYERIKFHFYSDLYCANSLREISDYFKENPPNKKFFNSELSALVLVRDLEVKMMNPDNFDEKDEVSLAGLDKGLCFPILEIKDNTDNRFAYWMAGDSKKYLRDQETFGFNRDYYVRNVENLTIYGDVVSEHPKKFPFERKIADQTSVFRQRWRFFGNFF
ncbi:MAG: hypothetical protein AABW83_03850 [Nanoarchaeota archaeon]